MATIGLAGLTKSFDGRTPAVDHLDLTIEDGEFLSLLGPSGCGKTTTLRCIAGLEKATSGEITFDGNLLASPNKGIFVPPEKRQMGMVFQSYALWPHMTTESNVAYPLKRTTKLKGHEIDEKVHSMLSVVGLAELGDRLPSKLSGGQQQRVALARALVNEPKVVLFDEPFSNLDTLLRGQMRREIRALHERLGTTSIYVTHDRIEAMSLSDRIVVMRNGLVQQIGSPREVYNRPVNRFVADFMGFDNILTCDVVGSEPAGLMIRLGQDGPTVRSTFASSMGASNSVSVALRASGFRVLSDADTETDSFTASIEGYSYLGEDVEYQVKVGEAVLIVRIPDHQMRAVYGGTVPVVGDKIRLQVTPAELVQIAD